MNYIRKHIKLNVKVNTHYELLQGIQVDPD